MSYYSKHVFFCTNVRDDGSACCGTANAQGARDYMKSQCKLLGLSGPGKVRVNNAGCLDRCDRGPVLVIYPAGTWYTYVDLEDIDEIIRAEFQEGRSVPRLLVD
jgi:(2Fe-2S) ferredoxin